MTRGRRVILQFVVLGLLAAIDLIDDKLFVNLISIVLVILPPINWTVASILIWTSRQAPEIESLRERADDAVTLALVSTAFAGAGLVAVARIFGVIVPGRPALVLLAFAGLIATVPAVAWLGVWRSVWLPMLRRSQEGPS